MSSITPYTNFPPLQLFSNVQSALSSPLTYETISCYHPTPEREAAVCDWSTKKWVRKFDIKTKKYYYTLEEEDPTDNFFEKKMRKRYIEKGKRYE